MRAAGRPLPETRRSGMVGPCLTIPVVNSEDKDSTSFNNYGRRKPDPRSLFSPDHLLFGRRPACKSIKTTCAQCPRGLPTICEAGLFSLFPFQAVGQSCCTVWSSLELSPLIAASI
jgi:hypothetical protein